MKVNCDIGETTINSINYCNFMPQGYYFFKDGQAQTFLMGNREATDSIETIAYYNGKNFTPLGDGNYYNLKMLLSTFGLNYSFQDNTLNITGTLSNVKKWEAKKNDDVCNFSSIGYSLPIVKINIQRDNKPVSIPDNELVCFIYYGQVYISADEFAKAIGMEFVKTASGYEFREVAIK